MSSGGLLYNDSIEYAKSTDYVCVCQIPAQAVSLASWVHLE